MDTKFEYFETQSMFIKLSGCMPIVHQLVNSLAILPSSMWVYSCVVVQHSAHVQLPRQKTWSGFHPFQVGKISSNCSN